MIQSKSATAFPIATNASTPSSKAFPPLLKYDSSYMSKIRVKYLGATPLKKIVTLLQISSEEEGKNKKGIVIMGRQHAGETPSSYIVQSIIEELLTATQ